jgi:hypothetical protein
MTKAGADGAVVHVIDDDASLRASLDSLFRSVGLTCRVYESTRDFLEAEIADASGCSRDDAASSRGGVAERWYPRHRLGRLRYG